MAGGRRLFGLTIVARNVFLGTAHDYAVSSIRIGLARCVAPAALLAQARAQNPALNVRMGLWDPASTMNIGGDMPGVDMTKMTPEQKAHMQAMMQNMMGAHPTTVKSCLTPQKFDEDAFISQRIRT